VKTLNSDALTVRVPVVPIDDSVKEQIRKRLVAADCLDFNSHRLDVAHRPEKKRK
jgi:hypothetical protein